MYNVFSIDGLSSWIYVETGEEIHEVYIARAMVYIYFSDVKNITYIGNFKDLEDIKLPVNFTLDGYSKESFKEFVNEYSFNLF